MRPLLFILSFLMLHQIGHSQGSEEEAVQTTIESFFKAFHARDTSGLREFVVQGVVLQTIFHDQDGIPRLRTEDFDTFLRGIAGIPKTTPFEERLLSHQIQVDDAMAHAWTEYEFWLAGTFHHCGVNSFQLFHDGSNWKINYLVDTRRTEDCRSE